MSTTQSPSTLPDALTGAGLTAAERYARQTLFTGIGLAGQERRRHQCEGQSRGGSLKKRAAHVVSSLGLS